MMQNARYDAIVIGGGVNGLTCAALLGKAGLRTLVLERRDVVGGCAAEHELAPGFRVPTLAHRTGPLRSDVVEELQLTQFGLRLVPRSIRYTALSGDGRVLPVYADTGRAAAAIRSWSAKDAAAWPAFARSLAQVAGVAASLFARTPPDMDDPGTQDLWTLMRAAGAFRGLSREDQWRLLRWGPMAVADLVTEVFETELLRAAVAADGLLGTMLGPWSAGSGLQLLFNEANRCVAASRDGEVEGGPAAVARALARAATRHGVDVRTGAAVAQIVVRNERASGVALESGETFDARAIISGVDPKRTFGALCDAEHLPPEFLWRIKHLRARGVLAKVNLALSALPAIEGATKEMLSAPIRIAPSLDYLEHAFDHAKYGGWSREPWIELALPSAADPALAPAGAHVLSAYVQWVPNHLGSREAGTGSRMAREIGTCDPDRDGLLATVVEMLDRHAPGLKALIVAAELITPADLDRDWSLTGGHIFHGELTLDQAFTMRPLLGFGNYRTPIPGLYLCGSGTHPGTGLTGGSGANAARVVIEALA
jgi:phytoene dehydrogenase-like protein